MSPETWAALEPGVYMMEGPDWVEELVMITADGSKVGAPKLACTAWSGAAREMPEGGIRMVVSMRPLERQGGLSGAMYWGEAIR